MLASMAGREQTRTLSRAKIQLFPDTPAVFVDFLAWRGGEGTKRRAASRAPWRCKLQGHRHHQRQESLKKIAVT